MKHSFPFFKKLNKEIVKNRLTTVFVDSFTSIPFVLSGVSKKIILTVESNSFDDIYSSFLEEDNIVGVPFFDLKFDAFNEYHKNLYNQSYHIISSSWKDVRVCVVDARLYEKKIFSNEKTRPLFYISEKGFSYEDLAEFLNKNKYKKVDILDGPGSFVGRGFIVEVHSFGEKNPVRFNFYEDLPVCFLLDQDNELILKKVSRSVIRPKTKQKNISLRELGGEKSVLAIYKKGSLVFKNSLIKSGKYMFSKAFELASFQDYGKIKKRGHVEFSKWLVSDGVFYDNFWFFPSWFHGKNKENKTKILPPSLDLIVGSLYVHSLYGVCQFVGYEENLKQEDRVCLKFNDGLLKMDIVFIDKLYFYSDGQQKNRKLDSLNKKTLWVSRKKKASIEAQSYVESVVDNYIKRGSVKKEPYVYDRSLFFLFLSKFPYKDTQDQQTSWFEICSDLCSNKPMDRLLCGDVGFGKTEVAIRASFLALINNKSVLVLAPTTVLAQQLFLCFNKRLSPFGYVCDHVSRLTTKKNNVFEGFLNDKINLIVGTHAIVKNNSLLSKASLFIVDEEHRFGVKDKEAIFSVNPFCDFLSLSATPIPRSLQFSLSGVRKISTMLSPPLSRKPIIISFLKYSFGFLKTIVLKEKIRGGQVFVVDNSVSNIKVLFRSFVASVPNINSSLLYGSMEKQKILKTMGEFRNKNIDVLFCTSIIESGIDVPSANSIVIVNSHLFGLSQLYQLKGRVGRSVFQSFAYLMYPSLDKITLSGLKRLKSLQKNDKLGSGYHIAVSDLSIRGPGSLLGYSQSGSSSVGFDFYSKLVSSAVASLYPSGDMVDVSLLPFVSLGDAFVPKNYILATKQRVAVYSFMSGCDSLESLKDFYNNCILRFGPPPQPFLNLCTSKKLSFSLYKKGVLSIVKEDDFVVFISNKNYKGSVVVLREKLDVFFNKRKCDYFFMKADRGFKFQFNFKDEDVYILVESLIQFLYE